MHLKAIVFQLKTVFSLLLTLYHMRDQLQFSSSSTTHKKCSQLPQECKRHFQKTRSRSTGEDAPSNTEIVLRHIKKSFLSASRHFLYLPGVSHYPSHMQITHCSIVLGNVIVYVGYYKEVATVTNTGASFVIWQASSCVYMYTAGSCDYMYLFTA